VSKWLTENADVFGIDIEQNQATANVDPADVAAYKRLNAASNAGISPERGQDIMSRLMNANSKEELDSIIAESGM
jgi:hypothetical protein